LTTSLTKYRRRIESGKVIAVRQSTHCGQQDEMIKAGMEINGELLLLQAWRSMTCDIIANDVADSALTRTRQNLSAEHKPCPQVRHIAIGVI